MSKYTPVIIGDTHIGSTTALMPPRFQSREPKTPRLYTASAAQDWIYSCWKDYIKYIRETYRGTRLIVIHLGDVVDGYHHNTTQATPSVFDQECMAVELLQPLADIAHDFHILMGTGAHAGESEKRIAQSIGAQYHQHLLLDIAGIGMIDALHHPSTQNAKILAERGIVEAGLAGRTPPRYVLRAHRHQIQDSGETHGGTRAIIIPSWQLQTEYGVRVAGDKRADIGGVIIRPDGTLDMSRARYYATHNTTTVLRYG